MSAQPYVLATSCAAPDQEFTSLRTLAQGIGRLRDLVAGRPALHCVAAVLTRCELPGGRVVAVRLLDGTCGGKGSALGYAFLPREQGYEAQALQDALAAA